MTLRLIIADDNEIVRMGVRSLLKNQHNWEICGEAANGREAIAKVREFSPDVIVLDLSMPIMNGFEAAKEIRRVAPATKIVLLSVHDVPVTAREAGADAFVSKTMSAQEIIHAIEQVSDQPDKPRSRAQFA